MPNLSWYARRLGAMSRQEICWRLAGKASEAVDRCLLPIRRRPPRLDRISTSNGAGLALRHNVVGAPAAPSLDRCSTLAEVSAWATRAGSKADALLRNRMDLFDLEEHDLGSAIDWNYEYKAGRPSPMSYAPTIDYRDYSTTGDCKFVWEPSRHQHLVTLARAYRLTGRAGYAQAVLDHIDSWIEQCPYPFGMNWRSPLELGIRIINWVWAIELIRPSGLVDEARLRRLLPVVFRHLQCITRRYSRYSSANNHLIGEAAGVFIASSYFGGLRHARKWRIESREILASEILNQTYADGGTREQAMGYHLFVLEFFLVCEVVARNVGASFPKHYLDRLQSMCEYVMACLEAGGSLPMFGDCDDGYVLDLGDRADRARAILATAAVLFDRPDFKAASPSLPETLFWLLGVQGCRAFNDLDSRKPGKRLTSRSFDQSGYYLLQSGVPGQEDCISVGFDCGDLGYGAIAAHGHADALSFTLRAFGVDVFIDPGTYDYFTYPAWRNYFRSTRSHNTVVVDEQDQSEMLGPFLWGRRAHARCLNWEPSSDGGTVTGEHDGYTGLADPVRHRRTVSLDGRQGELHVQDHLRGAGTHTAAFCLHLAERWSLTEFSGQAYTFTDGQLRIVITLDDRLHVQNHRGSEEPIAGWASCGYHRKQAVHTLVGRCEWQQSLDLRTKITVIRDGAVIQTEEAGLTSTSHAGPAVAT